MNREDFDARLVVASTNILRRGLGSRIGLAQDIHSRLLDSLDEPRNAGRGKARRNVDRRSVVREFNEIASDLVSMVQFSLIDIRESGCLFLEEQRHVDGESDEVLCVEISFDNVFEFQAVADRFHVVPKLRRLAASQQLLVCRCLDLHCEAYSWSVRMDYENKVGRSMEARGCLAKMDDAVASVRRLEGRFDKISRRIYSTLMRGENPSRYANLPISVSNSATSEELVLIAGWYEEVAEWFYQPYQIDERSSEHSIRLCRGALELYREARVAFLLLGAWLRCLAPIGDHRRCQVCYRHLGRGLKRFCRTHARTSAERQASRDLHISNAYRPAVASFLKEAEGFAEIGKVEPMPQLISKMKSEGTKMKFLPQELIAPAAILAALLRGLWPAVTTVLQQRIENHFELFLKAISAPFEEDTFANLQDKHQNSKAREVAVSKLNWATFFRTWFGSPTFLGLEVADDRCRDVDHPSVKGLVISPSQIAVDLAHYRVWVLADETFDRYAYLNLATVSQLRSSGPDGSLRSYAEIGRILGVSGEAVRRTLQYNTNSASDKLRRERILPAGVERARRAIFDLERASRAFGAIDPER